MVTRTRRGARWTTLNARYKRLGAFKSLPVYIDEGLFTMESDDIRQIVYSMTTGRSRFTLKQDRSIREAETWSTVLITSTNDSWQAKLRLVKKNSEAEAMRLFEFRMP